MFAVPSNDVPPIVLAFARAVAVAALPVVDPDVPDTLPVTLPVTFPSKFATNVPVVIVKLPVLAPVNDPVPTMNLSADSSNPINALSLSPLSSTIPMSLPGVPVVPLPNSISLSDITEFVVASVVVVPLTVKLPVITAFLVTAKSLPIVTSSGCEIVTVPELSATVISFDVPEIVNVPPNATALVLEPSEIVIELFVNDELAIFDNVLLEALIVLFVNVSVVSLKTI